MSSMPHDPEHQSDPPPNEPPQSQQQQADASDAEAGDDAAAEAVRGAHEIPMGEQDTVAAAHAETVTDIAAGKFADDAQADPPQTLQTRFDAPESRRQPGPAVVPPTAPSKAASRRVEPAQPTNPPPRRRRRRILFRRGWWWRYPVHTTLILLLLFVTRGLWLAPIVVAVLEAQLAEALAAPEVTVRGVSGTYFTSFEIHGLRTHGEASATHVRHLALRSAEVHYSLLDLLRGKPEWLDRVEVDGLVLTIDAGHPPPEPLEPPEALTLPPWLPQAALSDARIVVQLGEGSHLRADELDLTLRSAGDTARVDLTIGRLAGRFGEVVLEPAPVSLELLRRGPSLAVTRLDWADVHVREPLRVELGDEVSVPSWIAAHPGAEPIASGRYQPVTIAGTLGLLGGSLFLDTTLALPLGETWQFSSVPWLALHLIQAEGLDLAHARRWPGFDAVPLTHGSLTARLDGTMNLADPLGAAVSVELSGGGLHVAFDLAETSGTVEVFEAVAAQLELVELDSGRSDSVRVALEKYYLNASLSEREVHDLTGMLRLGKSELHLTRAGLKLPRPLVGSDDAEVHAGAMTSVAVTDVELKILLREVESLPQVLALPLEWPAEIFAGIEADVSLEMLPQRLHAELTYRDLEGGGRLNASGWVALPESDGARAAVGDGPLPVSVPEIGEALQTGAAWLDGRLDLPSLQRWSEPLSRVWPELEPLRPLEGRVAGTFKLEGSIRNPKVDLDLTGRNWRYRHRLIGSWDLSARYDATATEAAPRLELERFVLVGAERMRPPEELPPSVDRIRAWLKAELDPDAPRLDHAFLDVRLHDLSRYAWVAEMIYADEPETRDSLLPSLAGSLDVSVVGRGEERQGLVDVWDVWLHARTLRLPGGETLAEVRLDGTLEPTAAQLNRLFLTGSPGTLTVAADVDWTPPDNDEVEAADAGLKLRFDISTLDYARQPLYWHLQRPTSGTLAFDGDGGLQQLRLDSPLSLDGSLGHLVCSVNLAVGERSRLQLQAERVSLAALPRLVRHVDPHERLGGVLDELSVRAEGMLGSAWQLDQLDWDLRLTAHDVAYDDAAIYTALRELIGFDLRAAAAQPPGFGEVEEPEIPAPAHLRFDLDLRLEGRDGEVRLRNGSRAQLRLVDPVQRSLHTSLAAAHATRHQPRNPLLLGSRHGRDVDLEALAVVQLEGRAPLLLEKLLTAPSEAAVLAPQWYERVFGFGSIAGKASIEVAQLERVRRLIPGLPIREGAIHFEANLSGTWRSPVASVTVRTPGSAYPIVLEQPLSEAERFRARYEIGARAITPVELAVDVKLGYHVQSPATGSAFGLVMLERGRVAMSGGRGWIDVTGYQHVLEPWLDIVFGHEGLGDGAAALKVRGTVPDLGALPLPLGRTTRLLGGSLTLDVDAQAPWDEPELSGSLTLDGVAARFSDVMPPVRNLALTLELGTDVIRIPDMRAMLGGSEIHGRAEFELADDPLDHRLHLELAGHDLPLIRREDLSVRSDVNVRIAGRLGDAQDPLTVSGEVAIVRGLIRQDVDFFSFLTPTRPQVVETDFRIQGVDLPELVPGQEPIRLNLSIDTRPPGATPGTIAPSVELRTNVVTGNLGARLNVGGTLASPDVRGSVNVGDIDVSLPTGWMRIDAATLTFDGRPYPQLRFDARMSMHGYEISGSFEGTLDRADTLIQRVTFTSRPPLPEDQVLLMVLTGSPPEEAADLSTGTAAAMQRVAVYIGQDLLRRMFGNDPEVRRQLLDRLRIEPGTTLSQSGEPMFTITFRLIDDFLSLGESGAENPLMIVFSRDRFDDFNAGVRYTIRMR